MRGWPFFRRKPAATLARVDRDDWVVWMRLGGQRDSTIDGYRRTTEILLTRYPTLAFVDITDEHIQGIVEEARPASRQTRRAAFTNWFGWGFRSKRITFNPMHHVPTYKQPPQAPVTIFNELEQKLLCALPDPDGTLMALLLGSGLRRSEASNLTVARVDLDHAELFVIEGAKGGVQRVVPLEHSLVTRLAGYFLTEGLRDGDFLWYCHPGGQERRAHDRAIVGASFHQWWKRCVTAAGVEYRKPHTTRHTYATEWRRRGLQIDDVGFLLGHADLKTTHRVYVHTKLFDVRKRMEALHPHD